MTGAYWCETAVIGGAVVAGVRVVHDGGLITAVDVTPARGGDVVLRGLALPGFANAHSHAFHRTLRGRTHDAGGDFWRWRTLMYRAAARLGPDSYRRLASAVFAEMALAGYTAVGEFHYVHLEPDGRRYPEPGAMADALADAAESAGIRLTLLDTLYLQGGLDESGAVLEPDDVQRRFVDGTVERWAARRAALRPRPLVRTGAAVHSVRAVPPEALAEAVEVVGDGVLHAHVSEQPAENRQSLAAWGATPVAVLAAAGALGPRFTAVHATHLTDDDVALLAASGSSVCLCPTTERDLGDGIGPGRRLADAGVPLAIGSDQNAVVDPFDELRALEGHERIARLARGVFTPAELLAIGTENGHRSLGWDAGRIEPGAACDLVAVATGSTRTAGADPAQLWLAASAADVLDTVVAGRHVVAGGRHALGDIGQDLVRAIAEVSA